MTSFQEGRTSTAATRLALAGWVFFDWAAQPFFSLIQSFGYAPYFVKFMVGDPVTGQAYWGYGTAVAAFLIALLSPSLGAVADQIGRHKLWIAVVGSIYVASCALLWFLRPGDPGAVFMALVAVCTAAVAIEIGVVINNAMLPGLVSKSRIGRLSGLGAALGNVGGIVAIFATLMLLVVNPSTGKTLIGIDPLFGLDGAQQEGARAIGLFSALWFGVFILPFLLFTPDIPPLVRGASLKTAARTLRDSVRELPRHPDMLRFLIAHMIYTDGLVTLFAMGGIFATGILAWTAIHVGLFGMLITIVGVMGAFAGGALVDRAGPKAVVMTALCVMMIALTCILSIGPGHIGPWPVEPPHPQRALFASAAERAYLTAGALIGLSFGALLASTRIILIHLSPVDRLTQFFGLFALSGRITAFVGPLCVALVTQITHSQRAGIAVLMLFLGGGLALLTTVKAR